MAKRKVPEEPMAPEQTVGNRFVREVKKQLGVLLKEKDKRIKTAEAGVLDQKTFACEAINKALKTKFKEDDIKNYSFNYSTPGWMFRHKGLKLVIAKDELITDSQQKRVDKSKQKVSDIKGAFCHEHELLISAQTSAMINKFKAFALARCDTKKNVAALTDKELSVLSKEFLATQRDHTCPL